MVGPTVLMVSIGTGAPDRIDSSKKMNCSSWVLAFPPYSSGQPMPSQPSVPICFTTCRVVGPTPCSVASFSWTSSVSSSA